MKLAIRWILAVAIAAFAGVVSAGVFEFFALAGDLRREPELRGVGYVAAAFVVAVALASIAGLFGEERGP